MGGYLPPTNAAGSPWDTEPPPPDFGPTEQVPLPNDLAARIAMSMGPHPFNIGNIGPKPTGLEALLALAAGFGNAKAGRASQRIATAEERNQQARSNAKALAEHRWRERENQRQREQMAANIRATQDAIAGRQDRSLTEQERHNRVMEGQGQQRVDKPPAPNPRAGIGGDPESWVQLVLSGQAQISNVPMGIRNQVADAVKASGETIVPGKARDTMNALNSASAILDQLDELSGKVNRGEGIGRLIVGAQNVAGSALQTNPDAALYQSASQGMLANLARAAGERGVLTDQDIARARKLIPSLTDSRTVARSKIANFRQFIEQLKERTTKTYTTKNPAGAGASGGGQRFVYDKNGKRISGGQ